MFTITSETLEAPQASPGGTNGCGVSPGTWLHASSTHRCKNRPGPKARLPAHSTPLPPPRNQSRGKNPRGAPIARPQTRAHRPRVRCDAAGCKHGLQGGNDPSVWRNRVHRVPLSVTRSPTLRFRPFTRSDRQQPTLALETAVKARRVSCQSGQRDPDTADTAQK